MTEIHLDLSEATIDGASSRIWSLHRDDCPELAVHRIKHLGITDAAVPYRRVRIRPGGSFVISCTGGRGRILLDGRWQSSSAGFACLAPPRVLNAFHAVSGTRWQFTWIRYEEPPHVRPIVSAASPVRVRSPTGRLARVVAGLRSEWESARDVKLLHHWIELVQSEARRIAQPTTLNDEIGQLWAEVGTDLAADWTLEKLALRYGSGKEQLRRLCLRELGRSPMQHLTSLRIERSQELLIATQDRVETIARQVGFSNVEVFSRAFKRWVGCSPSAFRG